jgi:hypothetical protein
MISSAKERSMSFAISLLFYVLGSAVIALCLVAIPGRDGGQATTHTSHDHGSAH